MGLGGANGISLVDAQQAYLRHGAVDADAVSKVRPPRAEEARDQVWRPYDPAEGVGHPLRTEAELREGEARTRAHVEAYRSRLAALRSQAHTLTHGGMQRRVRQLSDDLDLHYGEAEVGLMSHLLLDGNWPRRHPVQAFGWAWRHRRGMSLPARLSQLRFHPPAD